jgi:hypothetical protein
VINRPKRAEGGSASTNDFTTETKEKRKKKMLAVTKHFQRFYELVFLCHRLDFVFFDTGLSVAHCS